MIPKKLKLPNLLTDEQVQLMNESKTIYVNPTDGVTPTDKDATHKYVYDITGDKIKIHVSNYGYLTEKPIEAEIEVSFEDIRKWIWAAKADGNDIAFIDTEEEVDKILKDFPPEFVETVVWLYENYSGKELGWRDINESASEADIRAYMDNVTDLETKVGEQDELINNTPDKFKSDIPKYKKSRKKLQKDLDGAYKQLFDAAKSTEPEALSKSGYYNQYNDDDMNESVDILAVGDKVKFKPEALTNMKEPELINIDLIYDVVKANPRIVIEDPYGNAQKIGKKDVKYLVKQ